MSEAESWSRLYFLGGRISARRDWTRGFYASLGSLIGVAAVTSLAYFLTRQMWVFVVGMVIFALIALIPRLRDGEGRQRAASWGQHVGRAFRRIIRWDRFDPRWESTPASWGRLSVMGVAATPGKAELAVIEHYDEGYFSAVLRLDGGTIGIVELASQEYAAQQFGQFLRALAEGGVVDQVDVATRAVPADRREYDAWLDTHPAPLAVLNENVRLLGDLIESTSDRYQSWLVVRVPTTSLRRKLEVDGVPATTEALASAMFEVTADVGRLATQYGLNPAFGATPHIVGGMVRHLYDPDFDIDDLSGLERTWDGIPAFQLDDRGRSVEVPSAERLWRHCVGVVPRDGWPTTTITPRFLEGLIIGTRARRRLVVAQFQLMPAYQATKRALAAAAASLAEQRAHSGEVTTGEAFSEAAASRWMLNDITRGGSSGVRPMLRVMVSAGDAKELSEARAEVERAMSGAGCSRFEWLDGDHARGMVTVLPLARGIMR